MALELQMSVDPAFRMVRQQDLSGFKLTESVGTKRGLVPGHSHEERHLTLILAGSCYETYMGRKQMLLPFTVTHFLPGESHALEVVSVEPVRSFDIELKRDWLDDLLERPIQATKLLEIRDKSIAWLMTRLYKEFIEIDDVSQLAIEGLVLEIIARLARVSRPVKTGRSPTWLNRVVEKIHDESASSLGLSELAKCADVHPSHLARVFREHYGCTLGEFVRQVRVDQALQLLMNPQASLAEISLATGFCDQSHFSRVFKLTTGMTPAQFRTLHLDASIIQNGQRLYKTKIGS